MITFLIVWIVLSIPLGIIIGHLIETPDDDELL
jgi:hypothetical protein